MNRRAEAEKVRQSLINLYGSIIKGSGITKIGYGPDWKVTLIVDKLDIKSIPRIVDGVIIDTKERWYHDLTR